MLVGSLSCTDHYFRVTNAPAGVLYPKPSEFLTAKGAVPVVIATAGGGIQAGAWTCRVLEGLDDTFRAELATKDRFFPHVALISSVSGGSMGAFYAGAWLTRAADMDSGASVATMADAAAKARLSSLDQLVAWGWTGPDLWRALLPISHRENRYVDRSWVLESSWEERAHMPDISLAQWAGAGTGTKIPAFVFNASIVERGEPLAMTNSSFPSADNDRAGKRHLRTVRVIYGSDKTVLVGAAAARADIDSDAGRAPHC